MKNNIFRILVVVIFFTSCTTQKIVLSDLSKINSLSPLLSLSKLEISSPEKGKQVFTYEDFAPLVETPSAYYYNVHRADFKYYLENDSEPFFREKFMKIFNTYDNSTNLIKMEVDFKYFIEDRNFMDNIINIYMSVKISFYKELDLVLNKTYQSAHSERYFTGFFTYPRNKTMNSLLNSATDTILNEISNDADISSLK